MFSLILLLVFGSGLAYLALQNTTDVTFHILNYTFPDVPLFFVIIGSMLGGVLLSYIFYMIHSISSALKIHGKDKKIKNTEKNVSELTKKIHQLELEKESLKKESRVAQAGDKAL